MLKMDDGDLPGARLALDRLIDQLTDSDSQLRSELAQAHINHASVACLANDWDAALKDLDSVQLLSERLPPLARRSVLTNVFEGRARIYSTSFSNAFDVARAQSALEQLATMWPEHWMVVELESHVAFQRRDWDRAATRALHAVTLLEREGWARGVAACRGRAAKALLELGRLDEADKQLQAALSFLGEHGPPDLLSEMRLAQARLESRRGNHGEAWVLVEEALAEVESRVRRFVDVAQQQRFLLDKLRFYDLAFDIGLAHGTNIGLFRAWTVAERSKSFYLAHLLANADVPLFDGVDPQIVKALEALEIALDACERKLGLMRSSQRDAEEEAKLESQFRALSEERSTKLRGIMQSNPRWARLRNPGGFDAATLARTLPPDVTPLSFFWRDTAAGATLHVFTRSNGGLVLHEEVPWARGDIDELARHARRLRGSVDDYIDLLPDGLIDRVLPPRLREKLVVGTCLLISPHGRLRGLPLHALPVDDSILIARWPVRYVPSLGLPSPPKSTEPPSSVLLMGSSHNGFGDSALPDVESELGELEQLWRAASRQVIARVIDSEATPEKAGWPLEKWSEFGTLHFACHGRFVEGHPLDSSLRLGSDAVRGSELFGIKLNASVVALSACALGQRAERYGDTEVVSEEWVGLYLPLFYAGARSLVVSLWDANSQVARQFMVAFHRALGEGEKPHLAFQTALLRFRLKLPARWANWCLVGLP